ncbi:hypothetical protein BSKO_10811 [Bryopsis sp. KO-2023]|nr:hypothetical protein BSKO_10811 [Bryopsis sp. KO-2023]
MFNKMLSRRDLFSAALRTVNSVLEGYGRGFPFVSQRAASILPENVVYSGPSSAPPKRVTLRTLGGKYKRKEPITMVTAYDYPSAVHVDQAGIDILLVGDSVAMVVHGHDTTLPITLDDMLVHCRSVSRGARRAFLLGDMPFGSYEASPEQAVHSAVRLLKEGSVDGVKLEGASKKRLESVRAVVDAGVAVMGHIGLTPQMISVIGGFRPQGQAAKGALQVVEEAQLLRDAGCFGLVLECVPAAVAAAVQKAAGIPVIGIGAGPACDGQVLVYHDLLGFMQHPHHAKVTPKFCKQYGKVGEVIQRALQGYKAEVESREFPSKQYSPYKIKPEEVEIFVKELENRGMGSAASAAEEEFNSTKDPH